jgi:hypothetical protein
MDTFGNNYPAPRYKLVVQPFRYFVGDPARQFFLPDDRSLAGKTIVGIKAFTDLSFAGQIRSPSGLIDPAPNATESQYITLTFYNTEGEIILENVPYKSLVNDSTTVDSQFSGRVIPIKFKIDLRRSFFTITDPTTTIKPSQIALAFYYLD